MFYLYKKTSVRPMKEDFIFKYLVLNLKCNFLFRMASNLKYEAQLTICDIYFLH